MYLPIQDFQSSLIFLKSSCVYYVLGLLLFIHFNFFNFILFLTDVFALAASYGLFAITLKLCCCSNTAGDVVVVCANLSTFSDSM